ncbi:restriction endonuclease [Herbaspirillum huttiense]|uniref:restriction endonuclease n=1 Tax=Herbaspirillum huttiense TaxID=863372 RepID=UPI0031D276E1
MNDVYLHTKNINWGINMQSRLEIAVDESTSTTEQGQLLEQLGREILETQNFSVTSTVRLTGIEVDLLASHKQTAEKIFVECKAYRDKAISADVLTKIIGNVYFHNVDAGWLLATSELSKDAKGLVELHGERSASERRKLQIYASADISGLLVVNGRCIDPAKIVLPSGYRYSEDVTLLVSNIGRFWVFPVVHATAGVAQQVMYFHANDGELVGDNRLLNSLAKLKSSFSQLEIIRGVLTKGLPRAANNADSLQEEFDNILAVPMAEDWADYRPARPIDFIGRDSAQTEVMAFFESVRKSTTSTRLVAVKAPSGWGKSSFLNKLRDRCKSKYSGERYYFYAVDCRTAVSPRYAELAFKKCIDSAIKDGFINATGPVTLGTGASVLADESVRQVLESLRKDQKVLVLFFDQFEEITTKVELEDLFQNFQNLGYAVDAAGENVVLGFSWKTDGTVPPDHAAYHTWHNLSDRRYEIEIPPFSTPEVTTALNRFANHLGEPLNAQLRRMLADHCQGFPWLLKKLCLHVLSQNKKSTSQADILDRTLNVEDLFKKDLSGLSGNEHGCLKRIAADSPADFFQIETLFGGETVKKLINKRLVIRNATKLILYWDIFRDYVLTEKVPFIPVRYLPRAHIANYKLVLATLLERRSVSEAVLAKKLKVSSGTMDNLARDLVMIGNAERVRKQGRIDILQNSEADVCLAIHRFLRSHEVLRQIISNKGAGFKVSFAEIAETMKGIFLGAEFSEKTWLTYATMFVRWLEAFKIAIIDNDVVEHTPDGVAPRTLEGIVYISTRSKKRVFLGEAPPQKVINLLQRLMKGESYGPTDRNSLYVLRSLRIIYSTADPILVLIPSTHSLEKWLAARVAREPVIIAAYAATVSNSEISVSELGEIVANIRGSQLATTSKIRYGTSVQNWLRWVQQTSLG